MKSLICDYIRSNINWLEELAASPYFLKIKKDGKYAIFNYNQIESDFYLPIVQEARGIIIDLERIEPVCHAFRKFGNYGEGYVDEIDWSTARVQEKIDGSIVRIWNDGEWHVSSNGMVDAYKAILDQSGMSIGQIIEDMNLVNYNALDPNYTHIFELVSPYNRVVIDYSTTELYYLGRRNMTTGLEEKIIDSLGFKVPKEYKLQTLEDCLAAARSLESADLYHVEHEGFVVVDDNWNRVKIKNPSYVAAHHIRSKQPTFEDMFEIWLTNEKGEFLSVFPAYKNVFTFIEQGMIQLSNELFYAHNYCWDGDRKKFAIEINTNSNFLFKPLMFRGLDLDKWDVQQLVEVEVEKETIIKILKNRWKKENRNV